MEKLAGQDQNPYQKKKNKAYISIPYGIISPLGTR
jgi:hypothetical protein